MITNLPQEQFLEGLSEAIKTFIISDAQMFLFVEENLSALLAREPSAVDAVVRNSVSVKAKVVEQDERESGKRMMLNAGHTIGHALELVSHHSVSHGRAVALGLIAEAWLSHRRFGLPLDRVKRIADLFERMGIRGAEFAQYSTEDIVRACRHDKKVRAGIPQCVIIEEIGKVGEGDLCVRQVSDADLCQAIEHSK